MLSSSPPLSPSFTSSGGPASPHRSKKSKTGLSFDEELEMDAAGLLDDGVSQEEKSWTRKPLPKPIEPSADFIHFQQIDIDYTIGDPVEGMKNQLEGAVPIVRMYGTTEDGHSVMANVYGVIPYFWTVAPPGFREQDCELYRNTLNRRMKAAVPSSMIGQKDCKDFIIGIEIVQRASIMGYQGGRKLPFIKILLSSPRLVPKCRDIIETGMEIPGYGDRASLTYESNIPFVLRFMIDYDILGGNWIELQPNHYRMTPTSKRVGTAQIEVDVNHDEMKSLPPEGEWSKSAPLRILSFDIECAGRKGLFPEPEIDPVIQIANIVTVMGEGKPFIRNVFTLNTCTPIVGAHVLSFQKESQLLAEWQRFVQKIDPDIITGYNITNFDLYYLINRARKLAVHDFAYLGRITDKKAKVKETTFSSKAYGRRDTREVPMHGRVQLDMLQVIQREHKLISYSLNAVSAHFLGQQKEDVQHSIITDLFNGTPEDRRRLAVYCLKDAYLPLRLLEKLMVVINYTEMARVTGVPMGYLLSRGQQIKVVSQLYRQAKKEGLLIPYNRSRQSEETYEGAFVIPPKPGFYDKPIATLDFTSLYPSIMMAHNLCYSTLLRKSDTQTMSTDSYEISPSPTADCFVKPSVKKGVLPRILEDLIAARTKAKNDLKNEKDPLKRAVLDGRQLALKVSANSVYGFTGASVGQLPCFEISSSVTAYGRKMIETTKVSSSVMMGFFLPLELTLYSILSYALTLTLSLNHSRN
jgi:DNA polymerase delta subunit 1